MDEDSEECLVADAVDGLVELCSLMEIDGSGFVFLFLGEAGDQMGCANLFVHYCFDFYYFKYQVITNDMIICCRRTI